MKRAGANRRYGEQEGNPAGVLKGHAQVWLADWRASDDAGHLEPFFFLNPTLAWLLPKTTSDYPTAVQG